ncbi:tRNA dihydrouridine synthase [Trichlorobacter lovleyi]|uniref:tRNA dihydrouridine synthase n=1 Tax=Trichlorobacter lovleyi TaxID=313985 RepID=UPI003D0AAFE9
MSPLPSSHKLPWSSDTLPLMLAPMQGLTNRGLRHLFAQWVRPDTLFTEFMRVAPGETNKRLAASDLREIVATEEGIPLVVQLIGHGTAALVAAAQAAQAAGAAHINLNLGCPFGRMTTGLTGGGILQQPELLQELIPALRDVIHGSFSIKLRAGYSDPQQIFSLLPLFESAGVDFLVLHPRTVLQEYEGLADHGITTRVVQETGLPVIANGDVRAVEDGLRVLEQTKAAGLMLGRGAIADPLLFQRLRAGRPDQPERAARAAMLRHYLAGLLERYQGIFCGEQQILGKVKSVFATMDDPDFAKQIKGLKKARTIRQFADLVVQLT